MDVRPLWAFRLGDGAPFLQGPRGVAEAPAQNFQVIVTLVSELRVCCGGWRWEEVLIYFTRNPPRGLQSKATSARAEQKQNKRKTDGFEDVGPTDWSELGGTEGTGDVVHVGRRDLPVATLASSSASICSILFNGFPPSLKERHGGRGGGGGGEDGFAVDCGGTEKMGRGFCVMATVPTHGTLCRVCGRIDGALFRPAAV